jgi:hypothetical protein
MSEKIYSIFAYSDHPDKEMYSVGTVDEQGYYTGKVISLTNGGRLYDEGNGISYDINDERQRSPKTIEEWLRFIEDKDIREKALANLESSRANRNVSGISEAIIEGFTWGKTDEGSVFWIDQHNKYTQMKQQHSEEKKRGEVGPHKYVITPATPENFTFLLSVVNARRVTDAPGSSDIKFFVLSHNAEHGNYGFIKFEERPSAGNKQVSLIEFLQEAEKIPVVDRGVTIPEFFGEKAAKISKDGVEIGCQKWTLDQTKDLLNLAKGVVGSSPGGAYLVKMIPTDYYFEVDGIKITKAKAEELMAAVDKFSK